MYSKSYWLTVYQVQIIYLCLGIPAASGALAGPVVPCAAVAGGSRQPRDPLVRLARRYMVTSGTHYNNGCCFDVRCLHFS